MFFYVNCLQLDEGKLSVSTVVRALARGCQIDALTA